MNSPGRKPMKNNFPMDDLVSAQEKMELKFLRNHTHFLTGDIEEENIKRAMQWIAYENMTDDDDDKQLTLYINSYGGDLYQAFGLIDMMKMSRYPISTIGIGSIMSAAFMIFSAGTRGHRYIARNTGIMCHQFSDYAEGKFHDLKSQAKANDICNQRMVEILRDASGLTERLVKTKLLGPTDVWLTPEELVLLQIADRIL